MEATRKKGTVQEKPDTAQNELVEGRMIAANSDNDWEGWQTVRHRTSRQKDIQGQEVRTKDLSTIGNKFETGQCSNIQGEGTNKDPPLDLIHDGSLEC